MRSNSLKEYLYTDLHHVRILGNNNMSQHIVDVRIIIIIKYEIRIFSWSTFQQINCSIDAYRVWGYTSRKIEVCSIHRWSQIPVPNLAIALKQNKSRHFRVPMIQKVYFLNFEFASSHRYLDIFCREEIVRHRGMQWSNRA